MKKFSLFAWLFMWGFCCTVGGNAEPTSLRVAARNAIMAGDTKAATKFALAALKENDTRKKHPSWQYGNNIHEANQILGLAALREGRVADAKRYLIAAGKTPGSPQLDSFGPHMVLAQDLLGRGEKQAVIQYLDLVSKFWAYSSEADLKRYEKKRPGFAAVVKRMNTETQKQIEDWKQQIRAGKKPTLNYSGGLF